MVNLDKQTLDRIIKLAISGTLLADRLRGLVAQHPDDCDSSLVIPWAEVEELLLQHHDIAYKQVGE